MTEKEERKNTKKIFSDLSNVNELLLKWVGIKLLMVCWRTFYAFLDGFSLLCHWNVMHFFFPWGCLYQALHLQDKGGPGGHDPHLFRNCTLLGMLFLEIFFFLSFSMTSKSLLAPALPESLQGTCLWESRPDSKQDWIMEKKR